MQSTLKFSQSKLRNFCAFKINWLNFLFVPQIAINATTVPPRWKTEPSDVSVERNRHVTLHCQAEGVPTPTVQWKKATGKIILHDKAYHLGKLICLFGSCCQLIKLN